MANLAYLQLTRRCNQKCRFCSNPPSGLPDIDLVRAKKIINNFIKRKQEGVILTGGEPTLNKHLPEIIKYCSEKNFSCRIITNGQKTANFQYLKILKKAGLYHIHLSLYSIYPKIQSFLTKNKNSLKNIIKTLENLKKIKGITTDINTVINKYNADHLSENVKFIVKKFPFVRHFVWNNLDPLMIPNSNFDTIPKLNDFELELHKSLEFLEKTGRTFRVERVPLCYLSDFEYCSTETRKIIKKELRAIYFLDKRGLLKQENFIYQKSSVCQFCFLNKICAGLYQMDKHYSSQELYPVFVSKEKIVQKVLSD